MAELKPCPFCGGDAFSTDYTYHIHPGRCIVHFVECNRCHAMTNEYDTETEANEAWNRRTEDGK